MNNEPVTPDGQMKFYLCVESIIRGIYDISYRENVLPLDRIKKLIISELRKEFPDTKVSKIIGIAIRSVRNIDGSRHLRLDNENL